MTSCPIAAEAAERDGLYVYCVGEGRPNWLLGSIGLDHNMVYTVPANGLCCVVHSCRAQPYQSDDPDIIRGWVMAHHRVVDAAAEALGTVLPMAFNMIVQDGPGGSPVVNLKAWLAQQRAEFLARLARLAGKAEYGVQISWDRQLATEAAVRDDPELVRMRDEALNKPQGQAYLLRHKLAEATRAAMERQANGYVERFYERIRRCVDDVRVDKLPKPADGRQMLLGLSCLAALDVGALGDALDEIRAVQGISVRFTGPWPPYSFAGPA